MARVLASLLDLDHVLVRAPDLAAARAAYVALGFNLTPFRAAPSLGGAALGAGNHLVVLTPPTVGATNMIELSHAAVAVLPPELQPIWQGPGGLGLVLHAARDLSALAESWRAAGVPLLPEIAHEEVWRDPVTSDDVHISYRGVLIGDNGALPHRIAAVQVRDLSYYTRPDLQRHPNSAHHWDLLTLAVPVDAHAAAIAWLERLYDMPADRPAAGIAQFRLGGLALCLATPTAFAALHPGIVGDGFQGQPPAALRIRVSDPSALVAALSAGRVPTVATDRRWLVEPAHAGGLLLDFQPLRAGPE